MYFLQALDLTAWLLSGPMQCGELLILKIVTDAVAQIECKLWLPTATTSILLHHHNMQFAQCVHTNAVD